MAFPSFDKIVKCSPTQFFQLKNKLRGFVWVDDEGKKIAYKDGKNILAYDPRSKLLFTNSDLLTTEDINDLGQIPNNPLQVVTVKWKDDDDMDDLDKLLKDIDTTEADADDAGDDAVFSGALDALIRFIAARIERKPMSTRAYLWSRLSDNLMKLVGDLPGGEMKLRKLLKDFKKDEL